MKALANFQLSVARAFFFKKETLRKELEGQGKYTGYSNLK